MMVQAGISQGSCMARMRSAAILVLAAMLAGCVAPGPLLTGSGTKGPAAALPPMRWDHRPEAGMWTRSAMKAVAARDAQLASRVPADIATWCPGYETASIQNRRAFWVGLMSTLAKHESTWNPNAAGGGGRYIGLLQISPETARGAGCAAQSAGALKNGPANLRCAVKIFADDVGRDGVIAGKGRKGIGRDWGPFNKAEMRTDMAAWTRAQPYCAKK